MTFFHKNLLPQTPPTFSTIDKSSFGICFGVSYICPIRFRKFQFCPECHLVAKKWLFFTKNLVSKTSTFFAVAKWSSRIWLGVSFWSVIRFQKFFFQHRDQWATKNDVFLQKKYGSLNSFYNFWSSSVISWDMIGAVL